MFDVIVIGGGVCAQGDALLIPLKKLLKTEIFASEEGPQVEVLIASLGNDAGSIGAACLVMPE